MSADLKVTFSDLESAAGAMTTAAGGIQSALSALMSGGKLTADQFSHKGEKFADWYAKNMSSAKTAFTESHHSFQEIAEGLRKSAAVYALADAIEAKNAQNSGSK